MSFSFHAAGTKDQVRAQIDAAETRQREWNNHTPVLAGVLDVIRQHLDTSEFGQGVYVETNGHHDAHYGSLNLTIKPLNIPAVPAETPKDEPAAAEEYGDGDTA